MKSLLEDLFMGRIDIAESLPMRKRASILEEKLFIKTLTAEQQDKYEEIVNGYLDQQALEIQDSFITGFKTAVRFILESLTDTNKDRNI